jgi:hypothetical protein
MAKNCESAAARELPYTYGGQKPIAVVADVYWLELVWTGGQVLLQLLLSRPPPKAKAVTRQTRDKRPPPPPSTTYGAYV